MADFDSAISRLREFRKSWNDGDVIDEESGLTADDLNVLIREAAWYAPPHIGFDADGRRDHAPDTGFATNGE